VTEFGDDTPQSHLAGAGAANEPSPPGAGPASANEPAPGSPLDDLEVPGASPGAPVPPAPALPRAVWPSVPAVPLGSPRAVAVPVAATGTKPMRARQWIGVAAVAAVVGGLIGGGIVWAAGPQHSTTASITLLNSNDKPGAAQLASGESIPTLVKAVSPSVVSIDVSTSSSEDQGTGMIITRGGLVVTNNHVIAAAAGGQGTITVTRTGTTSVLPATLLGTDPTQDVALLQIQGASNLPPVTFGNSLRLQVGDSVVAIGNALGLAAGTPTVTQGIVSALGRTVTAGSSASASTETLFNMIQTDAAINPGNSGGPLIDSAGRVIGMNTAVAGATTDGTNAQNIGFAIPAARIEALLPSLLHSTPATVPHRKGAYLGVYIRTVTPANAASLGVTVTSGAIVVGLVPGLPAANAGIKLNDVIVAINGTTVRSDTDVATIMRSLKPGETVTVVVWRAGKDVSIPVQVGTPPA